MMLKLIAGILIASLFSFTTQKDDNSIPWSAERRLTWRDFKSLPDENTTNAALTSSKITFKYSYDGNRGFNYTIGCVFEKNSSWGRVKTDYILAHEQGHFDIAEIYARKLNKMVKAYRFNPATAQKELPALYQKIMDELAAAQNTYDKDTDFSRDKEEQAAWSEKINRDLFKLAEFAAYR
ncbi:MAG TPA: DUF922 domain-containing protein [Chitinophagaceae bacterium]|nr:DUF922 domain-containing protein [Chitinophagaceae bacterium]